MIVQGRDISYNLIKVLGEGSYGKTHLAEGSDGQTYAIKEYKRGSQKAKKDRDFEEEMLKTVLGICKDHTVCFIESIDDDQGMFVVMEYISGISVADAIFKEKMSAEDRRWNRMTFAKELVLGLDKIHSFGVVHQDIKGENLMVDPNTGIPKFIDFGLSCLLASGDKVGSYTVFGWYNNPPCGSRGTITSAPPEMHLRGLGNQILEDGDEGLYTQKYLIAHDIWSIGCMILNWVTKPERQIDGWYAMTFEEAEFEAWFEWIEDNFPVIYNIVCGLLHRDPDQRIDNFRIIVNYFNSLSGTLPVFRNTWNDIDTTKRVVQELLEWRCTMLDEPDMGMQGAPEDVQLDVFGVSKSICRKSLKKKVKVTQYVSPIQESRTERIRRENNEQAVKLRENNDALILAAATGDLKKVNKYLLKGVTNLDDALDMAMVNNHKTVAERIALAIHARDNPDSDSDSVTVNVSKPVSKKESKLVSKKGLLDIYDPLNVAFVQAVADGDVDRVVELYEKGADDRYGAMEAALANGHKHIRKLLGTMKNLKA